MTAIFVEVELQALLDRAVERLLLYLDEVLAPFTQAELASLELVSK